MKKVLLSLAVLSSLTAQAESFCIAHQGVFKEAPKNSLASLQAALDLDADGGEFDIQHTKEGIALVNHDAILSHALSLPGKSCPTKTKIKELSYEEIRTNCTLHYNDQLHVIPTLDEALELVASSGKFVFIELKDEPSSETRSIIKKHFSHDSSKLRIIAFKVRHLDTLLNNHDPYWSQVMALDLDVAPWGTPSRYGVNVWNRLINWNLNKSLKSRETSVWTVNKEKRIKMFLDKKVTYITTDEVQKCLDLK